MMAVRTQLTWDALERARALAQRVEVLSKNLSDEAEKLSQSLKKAGEEDDAGRKGNETA